MFPKAVTAGVLRRTKQALLVCFALLFAVGRAAAATSPTQGPGGPILVLTAPSATFGKYYAEILRTEGFNEFTVEDVSTLTASLLSSYDVVLLAKVPLNASQVSTLSSWVQSGGNLIAMAPDPQLAELLGITLKRSSLANGYLSARTAARSPAGLPNRHCSSMARRAGMHSLAPPALRPCIRRPRIPQPILRSRWCRWVRPVDRLRPLPMTLPPPSSIRARAIPCGWARSVMVFRRSALMIFSTALRLQTLNPTGSIWARSAFRRPTNSSDFLPT